ncbi:hypothetical protein [Pseudophaeobacter sp.]|uniref:hypothetical protein n=1 Tax=Pseudophaeobacter sp. TaxID=1971739 RepID=UPI00329999B9
MLAVQLLLPGIGKAETATSWIEICSDFGVIEIEVSSVETDSAREDCPDCDICLMCAAENGQARKTLVPTSSLALTADSALQMRSGAAASNPAQFWHDGRGPPRLQAAKMTCACGACMATTQSKGEAS